ncbi:major facilitator superfamily transporter [Acetobacter orleanensis NRIC 0473]|nr:MFS transporter [Acetobacter orleanensis]GBR25417.1 major facilitator superfamily transporter [Acetobacter orleanensis NRIC 0473]
MVGLEISSVPAILPTLDHGLAADFQQIQWIMNAYTLAMTVCLMASGALADCFGRKRVFMAGVVVFGLSSVACGLAENAPILIAARAVQGVGGAAMLACQIALLSHQFRGSLYRGLAFSAWGIVFGAGLGFGPLIGGLAVAFIGWRWVFLVHGPLAGIAFLLARFALVESSDPEAMRMDGKGIITLSLAVFCLVSLITRGQALWPGDLVGDGAVVLGGASFLMFIVVEKKAPRPMFDFASLRIPTFSGALLGAIGMNASFWPFVIYLPLWFQAGLGYDSVTAGFVLLAYTLPTLVAPPFGERILARYGPVVVLPLGLFVIGAGFLLMELGTMRAFSSCTTMLPGCVLAGTGVGLMNTPVANTVTAAVPAERAGMGAGMDMSVRMITLAITISLMGFILLRGIRASLLKAGAPGGAVQALGGIIAAGNLTVAETLGIGRPVAEQALALGFGRVLLYGLVCAWSLSGLSFAVLRWKQVTFGSGDCD